MTRSDALLLFLTGFILGAVIAQLVFDGSQTRRGKGSENT